MGRRRKKDKPHSTHIGPNRTQPTSANRLGGGLTRCGLNAVFLFSTSDPHRAPTHFTSNPLRPNTNPHPTRTGIEPDRRRCWNTSAPNYSSVRFGDRGGLAHLLELRDASEALPTNSGSHKHQGIGLISAGFDVAAALCDCFAAVPSVAPHDASSLSTTAIKAAAATATGCSAPLIFTRLRFLSPVASDLMPSHFIRTEAGAYAQFICSAASSKEPGASLFAVLWPFVSVVEGSLQHPEALMPHIKRGPASGIFAVVATQVKQRVLVEPFLAGREIEANWKPSSETTFLVNTMVSHLEPISGVKKEGSVPFRVCPHCPSSAASLLRQPPPPELEVTCPKCTRTFRW